MKLLEKFSIEFTDGFPKELLEDLFKEFLEESFPQGFFLNKSLE